MDAAIVLIRFLFGALLGGILLAFLAIWFSPWPMPIWLVLAAPSAAGLFAAMFGDRFLIGFARIFRWLAFAFGRHP